MAEVGLTYSMRWQRTSNTPPHPLAHRAHWHTPVALANSGWPNKRRGRGTRTNRLWPHLASRSSDGRIPAFRVVRAQFVDVGGAF